MEAKQTQNENQPTIKKAEPTIKKVFEGIENIDVVGAQIVDGKEPETITVDKAEYETLKNNFVICKTAVESTLAFIVPDNLRKLAERTLKEVNSK